MTTRISYLPYSLPQNPHFVMAKAICSGVIAQGAAWNDVVLRMTQRIAKAITASLFVSFTAIKAWPAFNIFSKPFHGQIARKPALFIGTSIGRYEHRWPASSVVIISGSLIPGAPLFWGHKFGPPVLARISPLSPDTQSAWTALVSNAQISVFVFREMLSRCGLCLIAKIATAQIRIVSHVENLQSAYALHKRPMHFEFVSS